MNPAPDSLTLVTGATGFIGSHLVERLVELGEPVRCLVRDTSSLRYLPSRGVELVYGELVTGQGLRDAVSGATTVVHAAGVTKALSESAYHAGNDEGTKNLLRACERQPNPPRRFVHISSLAAVGPGADSTPLTEDAPPHPITWYGKSKLAAEHAVRASSLASRAVIVRPPVVYGPRDTDVLEVFHSVARGLMPLIGRKEAYFSYIQVKDLVEAVIRAACCDAAAGHTYFVSNPEPVSWTAFAQAAAEVMGRRVRFLSVPPAAAYLAGWCAEVASRLRGRPGIVSRQKALEARCQYWICDSSRARRELGLTSPRSLKDGIAETLAWYKESEWLKW